MRRALFATLVGWVTGATAILAQGPMPPAMPSPYTYYSPRSAHSDGQAYEDLRRPAYSPQSNGYGPAYGSAPGPWYGPSYGPVLPTVGGMIPPGPNGAQPGPPPTPVGPELRGGPEPRPFMGPEGRMSDPRMMSWPNGRMNGAYGAWGNGGWNGCGGNGDCGDGCWDAGCGACPSSPFGPCGRGWFNAELLLWWIKGQALPPLVTRGVDLINPGIIGQPGTVIIFGNQRIGEDLRVGARSRIGFWLDQCQTLGIEGSLLFLGRADDQFQSLCRVGDVIARPFFNTDPAVNAPDAELMCAPGVLCGDVSITTSTEFYVADANLRRTICCNCNARIDMVSGFRYQHLGDDVSILENLTNLDALRGAVGEGFIVQDRFHTTNDFYGGQFGVAGEFRACDVFVDWRATVALGSTARAVTIAGNTTFLDPVPGGNPIIQPGGLLAQPSNIGVFRSADFSVIPEINVNLGYQISPKLRTYIGYSFLYWNNVARAGEQINLRVDANQLPTRAGPGVGTDPQFILNTSDFWAQGINFGLQLRY